MLVSVNIYSTKGVFTVMAWSKTANKTKSFMSRSASGVWNTTGIATAVGLLKIDLEEKI